MTAADRVAGALTALFVPGDRPERFARAQASGADVVIVDWEDAVAAESKPAARAATIASLRPTGDVPVLVRLNAATSGEREADIEALRELEFFDGIVVAHTRSSADLEAVREFVPEGGTLVALIESAVGVRDIDEIAAAPGLTRVALGAVDLALDLGAGDDDRYLDYARSRLVLACRAAGIAAPLDTPSLEIRDTSIVLTAARLSQGFGFGGKLCIHPAQVAAVVAGFAPSDESVAWARGIVGRGPGAAAVDGMMIDKPIVERARRIMARADRMPEVPIF